MEPHGALWSSMEPYGCGAQRAQRNPDEKGHPKMPPILGWPATWYSKGRGEPSKHGFPTQGFSDYPWIGNPCIPRDAGSPQNMGCQPRGFLITLGSETLVFQGTRGALKIIPTYLFLINSPIEPYGTVRSSYGILKAYRSRFPFLCTHRFPC